MEACDAWGLWNEIDQNPDWRHIGGVRTVSKSELKEHVLEYFQEIQTTGEPLIITDLGREAWEVRPLKRHRTTSEVLAVYAAGVPSKLPAPDLLMEPLPIEEWGLE